MKPRRRLAGARRAGGETGRSRRCADSESGRRGQILQRLIIVAQNLTGGRSTESVVERLPQGNQYGWTTKEVSVKDVTQSSLRGVSKANDAAIQSTLVLRLALNATARACAKERGLPRRALDSTQGKPCSVALLGLAFTMAEILLSLTIIGVVAAITLPSLTGNINERTWNTQRKALYARMSQAIALMPALNGYGTLSEETDSAGSTSIIDTAAEVFITDGLAKVMKINNICDNDHIEDCGIPLTYNTMDARQGSMPTTMTELNPKITSASYSYTTGTTGSYSMLDTKAAAFETGNGESILTFYNPNCVSNMGETNNYFAQPKICANMIYDLNGSKGPNTIGKDIGFMTILYPTDSVVVAPMPYRNVITGVTSDEAATACTNQAGEEYRIPTKDELASLFVNKDLISDSFTTGGTYHWYSSSKIVQSTGITNWVMVANYGEYRIPEVGTSNWGILCVKR